MLDIHDIFSPGQEIIDPDKFAGRKTNIARAAKALARRGASILVYGERGVGKTSFVEMVKLIAQGQVELLYRHDLHRLVPSSGFSYKVIAIECDAACKSTEVVLQRLITSPEGLRGLVGRRIDKIESQVKDSLAFSILGKALGMTSTEGETVTEVEYGEASVFETFTNLVLLVVKNILEADEGLLIVIDEFDRVKDTSNMASLIKTLSKNKVKFLISGIASSYMELLKDHSSIERQLYQGTIGIEPMNNDETRDVFDLAHHHSQKLLTFHKSFLSEVIEISEGYPYYVQLLGQIVLDHLVDHYSLRGVMRITRNHLLQALERFALFEPKFEAIYQALIGTDPQREMVLKALSIQAPSRINQRYVFSYCQHRGIKNTNARRQLAILLGFKNPEMLKRIGKNFIEFSNPLFKIFSRMRQPEFLAVEDGEYLLYEE